MKNILKASAMAFLLCACAPIIIQPVDVRFNDRKDNNPPVLLNRYKSTDVFYFVNEVDNNKIQLRFHEIIISEGDHNIQITLEFNKGSMFSTIYQGELTCHFKNGYYYTIEPSSVGEKLNEKYMNRFYQLQNVPANVAGKEVKVTCIEYAEKPENIALKEDIEKYKRNKITSQVYIYK